MIHWHGRNRRDQEVKSEGLIPLWLKAISLTWPLLCLPHKAEPILLFIKGFDEKASLLKEQALDQWLQLNTELS